MQIWGLYFGWSNQPSTTLYMKNQGTITFFIVPEERRWFVQLKYRIKIYINSTILILAVKKKFTSYSNKPIRLHVWYNVHQLEYRQRGCLLNLRVFTHSKLKDKHMSNTLRCSLFCRQRWDNPMMRWNKSEFGGLDLIHVDSKRVWVPDIFLYNK